MHNFHYVTIFMLFIVSGLNTSLLAQAPRDLPYETSVKMFVGPASAGMIMLESNEMWKVTKKMEFFKVGTKVKLSENKGTSIMETMGGIKVIATRMYPQTLAEAYGQEVADSVMRVRAHEKAEREVLRDEKELRPVGNSFLSGATSILTATSTNLKSSASSFYNYALREKLSELEIDRVTTDEMDVRKRRLARMEDLSIYNVELNSFDGTPEKSPVEIPTGDALDQIEAFQNTANEAVEHFQFMIGSSIQKQAAVKNISWEDVQGRLGPREAAIEYLKVRLKDGVWDSVYHYYAVLLTREASEPKKIYLGKALELESLVRKLDDQNAAKFYLRGGPLGDQSWAARLYDFCWAPVSQVLGSSHNKLYLSPTGVMGRVAFAALVDENNTPLVKKYNIVQVGSTRDVPEKYLPTMAPQEGCWLLAGGIDYELPAKVPEDPLASPCDLVMDTPKTTVREEVESYASLPETLNEINAVAGLLEVLNISHASITEDEASEDYFRLLGHTEASPPVIHVATHGYSEIIKDEQGQDLPDITLKNSGVILSGYGYMYFRNRMDHDGQWTSVEIAQQDLTETKLVVLSACNSGKGASALREGIFGIQRGLKLAGVKNLIVALWPVRDDAAKYFMTTFYKRWLKGVSIEIAFRDTQLELMDSEEYSSPYHWSAFQLLQ
ncbi:CHAT domain-containing protein [Neolewinella persica]|uniref:CHAT domain-containing protein n=1 Tax=Neolewinella persica TaxID=70998 RepID=UPI00037CBAE5|nr:CHAT domain-containing protein [Neolewinella persica]